MKNMMSQALANASGKRSGMLPNHQTPSGSPLPAVKRQNTQMQQLGMKKQLPLKPGTKPYKPALRK